MKEDTLKLINLSTGYHTKKGKICISEGINGTLKKGELTCLLGPNGAGKSTLLKTLSAFQHPLGGSILIEGEDLKSIPDKDLATKIGVVLTERLTVTNMSVYELISMGRSPYTGFWGRLSPEDAGIVNHAMNLIGISGMRDRMIQTLSDGERQKVMIAKAIAQQTPIILLDEPTAFLDYPSKVEIMRLLSDLAHHESKTIFLSTHDLELALQIADKVWLIDKSIGIETGIPEDMAMSGALEKYFSRDGIFFDKSEGLFKIDNPIYRTVKLTGEGQLCEMTRKALFRLGIAGEKDADSTIHICADSEGLTLNGERLDSIETLLQRVGNIQ